MYVTGRGVACKLTFKNVGGHTRYAAASPYGDSQELTFPLNTQLLRCKTTTQTQKNV